MHNAVSSEDGLRGIFGLPGSVNNRTSLQCWASIDTPAKRLIVARLYITGKGIRLLSHPCPDFHL